MINVSVRQDSRELALLERIAVALETIATELKPEDSDDAARLIAATGDVQERTAALAAAIPKE